MTGRVSFGLERNKRVGYLLRSRAYRLNETPRCFEYNRSTFNAHQKSIRNSHELEL